MSIEDNLKRIRESQRKAQESIEQFRKQSGQIAESKAQIEGSIERLESGVQSKASIERTKREIEQAQSRIRRGTTFKTPTQQPRPSGRGILNVLDDTANMLIVEANLRSNVDFKADIEKYGSISGARANQPKPTFKEARARLGLALIEPIIGGGREALFPFANTLGQGRPETEGLRIIGAIATPTASDLVFGWALAKTGATKAGRKLLAKLDDWLSGADDIFPKLTAKELEEVRQWEKMGHSPTSLKRSAQRNPGILTTIEEMAEFYEKNPAQFSAGASVIPEPLFIFNKVSYDFDMEPGELINFIKKNPNLFADGTLLSAIIPTLSNADATQVLEETTLFPPDLVDDTIEQLREQTWSDQTPLLDEDEEQVPIVVPIPDVKPDVIPDVIPDVVPDTGVREPEQIPITITETILDEPPPVDEPEEISPPLTPKQKLERTKLNLRLFGGAITKFKVTFLFPKSMSEVKTVEARSYPEAVGKAQRGRRLRKKQPKLIDIVKI